MDKFELRFLKGSLFTYITLVIMNSIKFIGGISSLGSVGKLLFCLLFIFSVVTFMDRSRLKILFRGRIEWGIFVVLVLIFNFYYVVTSGSTSNLLPNLAFPIYFIFYYLVVKLFIIDTQSKIQSNIAEVTIHRILLIFRKVLYFNFFFWFPLSIVGGAQFFQEEGGFGGFFEDEIHFGFYTVTGFLISFYFRYNTITKDTSFFNTLLLFIYGITAIFTSRNAPLVIFVTLMNYYFISSISNKYLKVSLHALSVITIGVILTFFRMTEAELVKFTSGRYTIWSYVMDEVLNNNALFIGKGILNLNEIVLAKHKGVGFYYLDSLDTLSFHSSYMEILSGGGVIALICFFVLIIRVWKLLNRIEKSITIGILTGAIFESFLIQPFMLIATLFYLIIFVKNMKIKLSRNDLEKSVYYKKILFSKKLVQPLKRPF